MKIILKVLLRLFILLLAICIVGIFVIYYWHATKWNDFYTVSEMKEMASRIEESPALPDKFYNAYEKIYPNQIDKTLADMSFEIIWFMITNKRELEGQRACNCIWASKFVMDKKIPVNYHSRGVYVFAHGLEKFTTEKKCLDFSYNQIGINEYAKKYFSASLDSLTWNQHKELIIRLENPSLYERNPELLNNKLDENR